MTTLGSCPLIYTLIGECFSYLFVLHGHFELRKNSTYFFPPVYSAREIRIIIGGQSTPQKKEIEVKISWDSNRDPTQEVLNSIFSHSNLNVFLSPYFFIF